MGYVWRNPRSEFRISCLFAISHSFIAVMVLAQQPFYMLWQLAYDQWKYFRPRTGIHHLYQLCLVPQKCVLLTWCRHFQLLSMRTAMKVAVILLHLPLVFESMPVELNSLPFLTRSLFLCVTVFLTKEFEIVFQMERWQLIWLATWFPKVSGIVSFDLYSCSDECIVQFSVEIPVANVREWERSDTE